MESLLGQIRGWSRNDQLSVMQLKRLSDHKYSATDISFLDQLCMQKFWGWAVEKYPLWLAPNLITMAGLVVNIGCVLLLSYYSPDGKQTAPWWCYILCAVGLFIYQLLDATDGKQARRTRSSSPLGELFDHGCDSLAQVFITLETALSLQLGVYPTWMLLMCLFSVSLFYFAHWQTYVSGTLRFNKFDVTEAQFLIILICIISGVFGPQIWSLKIFEVELKILVFIASSLGALNQTRQYFTVVFTGGVGKNGSTVAGTSVLFPVLPILAAVVPGYVIYNKVPGVFEPHLVLYCVTFGLVTAKVTNRLVVAHMSKSELQLWDSTYWGPVMLFLNQYFDRWVPEYPLLWVCMIFCLVDLLIYCVSVCDQICGYLKIKCFTIPLVTQPHQPNAHQH